MKLADFIIKKLGGYTRDFLVKNEAKVSSASYKTGYRHGYKNGLNKKNTIKDSYRFLKSEVHRKLDIMFPGVEFDRARYRWLKQNTKTSSHISEMTREELKELNNILGEL